MKLKMLIEAFYEYGRFIYNLVGAIKIHSARSSFRKTNETKRNAKNDRDCRDWQFVLSFELSILHGFIAERSRQNEKKKNF